MQMTTVTLMDATEARECVNLINKHLGNLRALLHDLHNRKGWEALGYQSWRECVNQEFAYDQSYLYRLLSAAQVEINIHSPVGEIPERQLRELAKIEPMAQRIVYEVAKQTAPNGDITAAHLKSVVNVFAEVVTTGAIDDGTGVQIKVSEIIDAAINEETHERKERQKAHISGDKPKPVIAEGWCTEYGFEFAKTPDLKKGVEYRVLFYEVTE
jgi:hypothetical protein